jgi:hypothetical protein
MLGVGLTFNLGRDITLLVLWPAVFAYCFVRLIEICAKPRVRHLPQLATIAPADPVPVHMVAGRLSQ